jgi:uncharacterized protein
MERSTANLYGDATRRLLILAPGAGAGQDHPFMTSLAGALAARGIGVVTFDFYYRAAGKRLPDRNDALERCWRAVLARAREKFPAARLFAGGKSMGGRIATQVVAAGERVAGVVLLGYPLHPPGQPEKLRVAHLPSLAAPTLVLQGRTDPFGAPDELRPHFPPSAEIISMPGGHSFAPAALPEAAARIAEFIFAH